MGKVISTYLAVALFGVWFGWFFEIETVLTLTLIGTLLSLVIFVGIKYGSGGSGMIGVFLLWLIPLVILTIMSSITGIIVHWNDLIYILR